MPNRPQIKNIILFLFILNFSLAINAQVKFVIESLPGSTPINDTLFVCGTFNDWVVNDKNYILQKQLDGKYSVIVPVDSGKIEYKFSRGSWMKIETSSDNEYMHNRVYESGGDEIVGIKIANWQDLGGAKGFDYMVFLLFAAGVFGIILLLLVNREKKRDPLTTSAFLLANLLLVLVMFGGVFFNQANLIWKSNIALMGHVALALWGPSLFLFVRAFFQRAFSAKTFMYFLPALIIALLSIINLFNFRFLGFLAEPLVAGLNIGNLFSIVLGTISSLVFLVSTNRLIFIKANAEEQKSVEVTLITRVYYLQLLAFIFFIVNIIVVGFGSSELLFLNYDLVFIALALTIVVEFYYLWKHPEILRDATASSYNLQNAEFLEEKLLELMETKQPYKQAELNVGELAEMLSTKSHIVSKLINEIFKKSFRDFINEYRINEFIRLSEMEEYAKFTYLALAHEVGFNSKSTFNLAFKKQTGLSPREFFKKKHRK